MPTVSVIMGIYNCETTLDEAILSILSQTYKSWELIMCDDGSQDNTYQLAYQYVKKYPERIILLKNEKNMGLNYTLNRCLKVATGKYIARMDADDRCSSERFAVEVAVLESEPSISIVSTDMEFFDESGVWGYISHPEYPTKKDFVHGSPFCHAPSMVRKSAYDLVNGYTESVRLLRVEDYHLWYKMYGNGLKGKNLNKSYYQMRDDRNAYSRRKYKFRINEAYVKFLVVNDFKLNILNYVYIFKPLIVGLLPPHIYNLLHKYKLHT